MSTYLELVQELAVECGVTGTITTTASQSGEYNRLVRWVAQAYTEIQNMNGGRWRWLRSDFTFDTVADDFEYSFGDATDVDAAATITRFSSWRFADYQNPPKQYLTSGGVGGQTWLIYAKFDWWRNIYSIGTQTSGVPHHIAVSPRDTILLGPTPDDIYTITGEYFKSPQILSDDSDTPEMPAQYHQLIVYKAMEKYAGYESANEVMIRAQYEGMPMLRQLYVNQGPRWGKAKALA